MRYYIRFGLRESDYIGGESRHVCPKCHQSSHWNARDCGNCGYEFGSDERKYEERIREDERRRIANNLKRRF